MAEIAEWGGIRFLVEPEFVRGMRDLKISMQLETEDKTSGGEKFVAKKNAGGYEISLTAVLDGRLGIEDVKGEALALTEAARVGKSAYFYMAGKKLITPSLMLTEANISNIRLTGTGAWVGCEAALRLKQCEKYEGGTGGGGGGSGGGSGGGGGGGKSSGGGGGGGNKGSGGGGNNGGNKPTGVGGKPTGPTVDTNVGPKPGPNPRITPY